ncbi:MAG: PfkB family carbohydrate kinase [Anaerovoracaceae bacterium]|jgi:pseudouridine kinase
MNKNKISVIGGINVELTSNPYGQLVQGAQNPGKLSMKMSGSGRNIAVNLARMGVDTSFVTRSGDDFPAKAAIDELAALGADVSKVIFDAEENTPAAMQILNIVDGLEMAFGNADVLDKIDKELLSQAMDTLRDSAIVSVDANVSGETLDFLFEELGDVPLFLDPAGAEKAEALHDVIGKFYMIAPNRAEAEKISGLPILSGEELMTAGQWFSDQGVERVFITLAGGGVYYNHNGQGVLQQPGDVNLVDKRGAGDAFSAALLYAHTQGLDMDEMAKMAMAAAAIAAESPEMASDKLSLEAIRSRM